MAPPHVSTTSRPSDDLDDLFNFLDADTDVNANGNALTQPRDTTTIAPPRRRLSGDDPLASGLGIDEEVKVRKPRAPIAKLDEDRLLSDNGIPRLRTIAKTKIKFRGKGHEFQDVSRLLNTYQLWLDALFPKANFADGLAIIEKLGHKKRVQVMRKGWIDEDRPKIVVEEDEGFVDVDRVMEDDVAKGRKDDDDDDDGDVDMQGDNKGESGERHGHEGEVQAVHGQGQKIIRSSSPVMLDDDDEGLYDEAEPTDADKERHEAGGEQEPDEDELDALLAEDAARPVPAKPQNATARAPSVPPEGDDFADDEEAMAEMDIW